MSDDIRIALVAEGPTDKIVIEAALRSMLRGRSFILTQLQPEESVAFGAAGGGWGGVFRWCRQAAVRGRGGLGNDHLPFLNNDLLIIHLDADVARSRYSEADIRDAPDIHSLPCEMACPPPSATTDALRRVLLGWCGETEVPARTVLCIPSKGTEAWVVAALFPKDQAVKAGIECWKNPASRLGQQPKARRIRKTRRDYLERAQDLEQAWPRLVAAGNTGLQETARFQSDVLDGISPA